MHAPSALPSLDSILGVKLPTLQHVPKGTRDAWADILMFGSITSIPSDLVSWLKCFMVAKCVLFNLAKGGHCSWRDTLKEVRSRIKRLSDGDLTGLLSEVLEEEKRLKCRRKPRKVTQEFLQEDNARRARHAVEMANTKRPSKP